MVDPTPVSAAPSPVMDFGGDVELAAETIIATLGTYVPGGWEHPGEEAVNLVVNVLESWGRAQQAEGVSIADELDGYAEHGLDCHYDGREYVCACGLSTVRARLSRLREGASSEQAQEIERLKAQNEHLRREVSGRPSAALHEAAIAEQAAAREKAERRVEVLEKAIGGAFAAVRQNRPGIAFDLLARALEGREG